MCGIAGIFSPFGPVPELKVLRGMLGLLRHRGPDGFGIFRSRQCGLAHARLSIIDLAGGAQPMSNEDDSLWIVFNGEIFNYPELRQELVARGHRFRTASDTEVILHLYEESGVDALTRLNGQFAFAILDRERNELFLARDRMGIRPLYYTRIGSEFVFASEIKAILSHPGMSREIDPVALDEVFTFWFPLSPRTIFRNVSELKPGCWMRVDAEGEATGRYWSLPLPGSPPMGLSMDDCAERLRELLVESTTLQLRSDVPVGAYLSGGLDSAITASIAKRLIAGKLSTYSLRFDDPEFDEGDKQHEMSNFLGTEHQEVLCGPEQIAEAFPAVLRHTEVPLLRTAPVPMFFLSRLVRENQGKVVLTGEGADELFAGYDIFKELALRDFIARVPESRYRPLLLRKLYPYLDRSPSRSVTYARSFFCADPAPFDARFRSHAPRWNMTSGIKQFYSGELARQADSPGACGRVSSFFREFETGCASDPLTFSQEIETRTLLPGYLLSSQGDRMMMANSVEGRFPFLDHRIVEFAFGLPPRFRLSGLLGKRVLRKAMSGHIPEKTRNMPKQPYRAPDARCFFAGKDSELVSRYLCDGDLRRKGYFDPESTGKLVRKCRAGKATGFRDNMAFVGILSVQILDDLFVNNREAAPDIPDRDLVIIDELSPSERNRGHQGENQWT